MTPIEPLLTYNELLGWLFLAVGAIVILVPALCLVTLRVRHHKKNWENLPENRKYYSGGLVEAAQVVVKYLRNVDESGYCIVNQFKLKILKEEVEKELKRQLERES